MTQCYVQKLEKQLKWAYKQAFDYNSKHMQHNKDWYDCKVRCSKLIPGDLCLVCHMTFKGKHKIAERWESQVYEVTGQDSQSDPVYMVKNIETGEKRTLHRNCLFPISHRVDGEDDQSEPKENAVQPCPMADKSEVEVSEDEPLPSGRPVGEPEYTGPTTHSRVKVGADV